MKGYWNGEPAEIKGLEYTVTEVAETPLHWQNAIVGTRRQGIEIEYLGEKWIIDNQNATGYFKTTEGQGSPQCGHASVSNPEDVEYIEDRLIFTHVNRPMIMVEEKRFDLWAVRNHPKEFKRLKALRDSIRKRK